MYEWVHGEIIEVRILIFKSIDLCMTFSLIMRLFVTINYHMHEVFRFGIVNLSKDVKNNVPLRNK